MGFFFRKKSPAFLPAPSPIIFPPRPRLFLLFPEPLAAPYASFSCLNPVDFPSQFIGVLYRHTNESDHARSPLFLLPLLDLQSVPPKIPSNTCLFFPLLILGRFLVFDVSYFQQKVIPLRNVLAKPIDIPFLSLWSPPLIISLSPPPVC